MHHLRDWWCPLCLATSVHYVVKPHTPVGFWCPVSGHTGHLLQDIVDRPAPSEGLVGPRGVERQGPDEFAVFGDDANVWPGDEEPDFAVPVRAADGDVAKPSQVAKGDLSEAV